MLTHSTTEKIRRMDVEEGPNIFPSFFIHRAPPLLNDTQKTIVSFNFNVTKPIESSYKNFYHADYFLQELEKDWDGVEFENIIF